MVRPVRTATSLASEIVPIAGAVFSLAGIVMLVLRRGACVGTPGPAIT